MNAPTKQEIKIFKKRSLMWLKKKKLLYINLCRHPEKEVDVNKSCQRYIELETEVENLKSK